MKKQLDLARKSAPNTQEPVAPTQKPVLQGTRSLSSGAAIVLGVSLLAILIIAVLYFLQP